MSATVIDLATARAARLTDNKTSEASAGERAAQNQAQADLYKAMTGADAPAHRASRIVLAHAQSASAKFELAASMISGGLDDLALSGVRLTVDEVQRLRRTITWLETGALRIDETATPTELEGIA